MPRWVFRRNLLLVQSRERGSHLGQDQALLLERAVPTKEHTRSDEDRGGKSIPRTGLLLLLLLSMLYWGLLLLLLQRPSTRTERKIALRPRLLLLQQVIRGRLRHHGAAMARQSARKSLHHISWGHCEAASLELSAKLAVHCVVWWQILRALWRLTWSSDQDADFGLLSRERRTGSVHFKAVFRLAGQAQESGGRWGGYALLW